MQNVPTPPTQPQPQAQPRSKLEFMYRDMLVECGLIAQRNNEVADKLHEISISLMGLPTIIGKAAASISNQASADADLQLRNAARVIAAAEQNLRKTSNYLHNTSLRNIWFTASLSGLCALLGGLLSALITAAILQS